MSSGNLVVRAGERAIDRLRVEGFHPDLFDTLVGASGGPKWLALRHIDTLLIERLISARSRPLDLIGSSIGSFRHACFAQADPHAAMARFEDGYVNQAYSDRPTMEEISIESDRILAHFLGEKGALEITQNERIRSHIIAARLRRDRGRDRGTFFYAQLGAAFARNLISRNSLQKSFSRIIFQPEHTSINFKDFQTVTAQLTPENLHHALLASGSIPTVMAGVRSIPNHPGTHFDGGIIDYHFNFEFHRRAGLVLFPHFFDRITPGWFDKPLRWRKPTTKAMADVVMIAPSDDFITSLPGGKVPDRDDFLQLKTADRIKQWVAVMDRCRALADELNDLFEGDRLGAAAIPFSI